jgi:hypothetical protein
MDTDRIDAIARSLTDTTHRRGMLGAIAAALLGSMLSAPPAVADRRTGGKTTRSRGSRSGRAARQLGTPALKPGENMRRESGIVNGLLVDRYTWRDKRGRPRSASLVRYGQTAGGKARGGYAVQLTYQVFDAQAGAWQTVRIDPPRGDPAAGFGYFVSHERWRTFDADACPDGSNTCPIASLHGENDSPLGLRLSGSGRTVSLTNRVATHEFTLNYPHWGTTAPVANLTSGKTPSDPSKHKKYTLPVAIRWTFSSGQDYPLWSVTYDLSAAPVNTVSVDMRGPYGYMLFDASDAPLTKLEWADQFHFATKGKRVATTSEWTWNRRNDGARYNLLVAGAYEMGLVEAVPYGKSRTGNAWSDSRGTTSASGPGCPDAGWRMPCDWSWPYQSIQYEAFDADPTRSKKLAWGSADYIGTSKARDDTGELFDGYPKVSYRVWITFDKSGGDKTRRLASAIV